MEINTFQRKTFTVQGVKVSEENMAEVATWCGGTIEETKTGTKFIKVDVHMPLNERQRQAFVGDRVLQSSGGFKVYKERAFEKCFEPVETSTDEPDTPLPLEDKNVFDGAEENIDIPEQ